MKTREFTGKTTEEAIQNGLTELGATIADVHVDVLQEGAKGLFGFFGSRPARVRITVMEDDSEEEDLNVRWDLDEDRPQKKEKKPEAPKKAPAEKPAPKAEPAAVKPAQEEKPAQPEQKPAQPERRPQERKPRPERKPEAPKAASETTAEQKPKERKPRPPKPRKEHSSQKHEPMVPAKTFEPTEPPILFQEDTPAGRAQRFLMAVTEQMGVKVEVYVDECRDDALSIRLIGDTLGILIGRRGETLDALQYLTSLQVNKGKDSFIRVTLDTENYRAKREDSLRRYALRMANRAQKTGRRVVVEPMNPYERRVMHTALQDNPYVETHSEGEEPNRRVVITLKAQEGEETAEEQPREEGETVKAPKRRHSHHRSHKPRNPQEAPAAETTEAAQTGEVSAAEGIEAAAELVSETRED